MSKRGLSRDEKKTKMMELFHEHKQADLTKAQKDVETLTAKIEETQQSLKGSQAGREDTSERRMLLADLSILNAESQALTSQVEGFKMADPVKYRRKKLAVEVAKQAAHRWTDNTIILIQYTTSVLGADDQQIRESIGVGEDWEELK
ncbi:hypothetical protein P7C73_g3935, partial [Tremellales sp. Uapishka_1]